MGIGLSQIHIRSSPAILKGNCATRTQIIVIAASQTRQGAMLSFIRNIGNKEFIGSAIRDWAVSMRGIKHKETLAPMSQAPA
jgi:GH24 family phage-related lysozyme (muramidase)